MTTRRDILKSGAGLAAILATGKAPAALVKSMLAARNSIGMKSGGVRLPYDAGVEYLESSGTQYIDTGVFPTANVGALVDVMPFNGGADVCALFCGSDTWRWGFGFRVNYTIQISCLSRSVAFQNVDWSPSGSRKTVDYNYSQQYKAYIDNELVYDNIPHGVVESPGAIWMFGANYNGTGVLWRGAKIRVYSCKMIDNGVLVRDFIPVRFTNEQGVSEGAMYDRVSGELEPFRNKGAGAFLWGPDASAGNGGGGV